MDISKPASFRSSPRRAGRAPPTKSRACYLRNRRRIAPMPSRLTAKIASDAGSGTVCENSLSTIETSAPGCTVRSSRTTRLVTPANEVWAEGLAPVTSNTRVVASRNVTVSESTTLLSKAPFPLSPEMRRKASMIEVPSVSVTVKVVVASAATAAVLLFTQAPLNSSPGPSRVVAGWTPTAVAGTAGMPAIEPLKPSGL